MVREVPGGWVVQGAVWTSAVLPKADAVNLAEGMATAVRGAGQAVRVLVQKAANDLGGEEGARPGDT